MPRLKRVSRDDLSIARQKRGRGFAYLRPNGVVVRDKALLARARHLGIPPAWHDVRIAPEPLAHIQACGLDDAGRVQYIYHPDWEARRARKKQKQLTLLTETLPRIRRRVRNDLHA